MEYEEELLRDAQLIEQQVSFIRRTLLRAFDPDKRRISLTSPQMQALAILTQAPQTEGMALKELSELMGLAQSTVSGIAERLEQKRLVRRLTDPADRRRTRIEVTERVKIYMQQDEPLRRLGPLVLALQQATDDERLTMLEGLALLQRLLQSTQKPE
jgi:MarR family transcriptional regulator, organic hydroperoxide resistance regulator